MFGEHNQRRPVLVEPGIHSRCDFHSAGEREANMHAIAHPVCRERAFDFLDDFFARRNFRE